MNDFCIRVEHLKKTFEGDEGKNTLLRGLQTLIRNESSSKVISVLNDLSCEIKTGEKVAVLGRNGCGKTTFLRILAGIYDASSGRVQVQGTPRILFRSSVGLNANISVSDNVYLLGAMHGIRRSAMKCKLENILSTAGITHLRASLLKKLSTGQAQRLALSVLFEAQGDLLILDEALGSIDLDFIHKWDDYFKEDSNARKTMILTSHDTALLRKYCSRAIWIDKGTVRMHDAFDKVNAEYEKSFL